MINTKNEAGELLFFRYAYPCAWGRFIRKKIDREHYDRLVAHADAGTAPNRQTLRYCFPHAFRRLREFANNSGRERWSKETVATFWRQNHGHRGDCRVLSCAVVEPSGKEAFIVIDEEENTFHAINHFRLDLQPLDTVFVHLRTIIEKEEK
jgi:hypothetical protein